MVQSVEALYISFCNHTRVVTKLQSKQQGESPEIWMKETLQLRRKIINHPAMVGRGGDVRLPDPWLSETEAAGTDIHFKGTMNAAKFSR